MMRRLIGLLVTLALGFRLVPLAAEVQQPVKLIGILGDGPAPFFPARP
jgi:hypothetical protein